MHEYHSVDALVKQILEKAKLADAKKVTEVTVVMGDLLGFDQGSIQLYFEEITVGTIIEAAKLNFKTVKGAFKCKVCENEFDRNPKEIACPECCSMQLLVTSGKEWYIDSIEVES